MERFNVFVQDDVALIEKKVRLIAGSKFEHNDFTGFEVQPNLRLLHDRHAEFAPQFIQTPRAEVERGVYSGFTWGF